MFDNEDAMCINAGELKLMGNAIRIMGNGIVEIEYRYSGLHWKSGSVCGLLPIEGEVHELPFKPPKKWRIESKRLVEFTRLIQPEVLRWENIVNSRNKRVESCENVMRDLLVDGGENCEKIEERCLNFVADYQDVKNSIPTTLIVFDDDKMTLGLLPKFSGASVAVDIEYVRIRPT